MKKKDWKYLIVYVFQTIFITVLLNTGIYLAFHFFAPETHELLQFLIVVLASFLAISIWTDMKNRRYNARH